MKLDKDQKYFIREYLESGLELEFGIDRELIDEKNNYTLCSLITTSQSLLKIILDSPSTTVVI